jgi:hypothetical protein
MSLKHTYTHTQRHTHTLRDTHTHTLRDTHTHTQTHTHTHTQRHTHTARLGQQGISPSQRLLTTQKSTNPTGDYSSIQMYSNPRPKQASARRPTA